ncbi:MAG: ABC transporter substrate-binding protein [Acidimicrobiia bacterium]|nr:MAG: ABC transporter substrate-binding protein [Acidimicrobiia bacterium]
MRQSIRLLIALAMLLAACTAGTPAGTEPPPPSTEATGFPVTIESGGRTLEVTEAPQRIVTLSPAANETIFAIGAGDQVIASDSLATFPADSPTDPDLLAYQPNVEAIVGTYEPDLVVMTFDPGDVVAGFEALGVPVLVQFAPATLDEAYAQWKDLGAITGHLPEAVALINQVQDRIGNAVASADGAGEGMAFYHELDSTFFSVTSTTFVGAMYDRFGLINVADEADVDGYGYPQLSAEYLIDRAPDMIFVTDCCGTLAGSFGERPGWDTIPAVANGAIHVVSDDLASRWGPRIADFAEVIADAIGESTATG